MSNEVVTIPASKHLAAEEWTRERIELLKRTICKDASDDELSLFVEVAKRSGLNPFARQIHTVKRWNKKDNRFDIAFQTGIDGYRLIADRTGTYAGNDDPTFDDEKKPSRATVTVYKMVQGQRCAFTATARWAEYCPKPPQDFMWQKMPCVMLSKCAEALALRKAFPAELSGMYTDDEMAQADRGVYPEQPAANDGHQPNERLLGKFTRGSFAKYGPQEVDLNKLRKWAAGLEDRLADPKKTLTPEEHEEWEWNLNLASKYIADFENNGATDFGASPDAEV